MDVKREEEIRDEAVYEVARKMLIAARTAPKGRGVDNTVMALVGRDGIRKIADKLKDMVEREGAPKFFARDAENILSSPVMLLFGTRIKSMGLSPCGLCGFKNCAEKDEHPEIPCSFNTGDLGIAVGSAASVAMDHRVDNRVMYTVGQAVIRLGLLGEGVKVAYAIPMSVSAKNPFFDRT
jgi:uncharacterized ferredoxin-like protein